MTTLKAWKVGKQLGQSLESLWKSISSLRHKTPITTRTNSLDAISSTSAQEECSQCGAVSQHSEAALSISSNVNISGGITVGCSTISPPPVSPSARGRLSHYQPHPLYWGSHDYGYMYVPPTTPYVPPVQPWLHSPPQNLGIPPGSEPSYSLGNLCSGPFHSPYGENKPFLANCWTSASRNVEGAIENLQEKLMACVLILHWIW